MPYRLNDQLVIGISSRALFQLEKADAVFRNDGLAAYRAHQREHEDDPLRPGTAFPLIRGLLALNAGRQDRLVEVIVMSRNDPDTAMRVFNSIEHHGIDITRGGFTDGRDAHPYLRAFDCNLFLSAEPRDVVEGLRAGIPAALVMSPPVSPIPKEYEPEVRIAFDGDAVLFDEESERIFQEHGLEAFLEHELALADVPMHPGPFEPFLRALQRVQAQFPDDASPIRVALVTARNAPAHKRVVNTLRSWGIRVDEAFFLGGVDKGPILAALKPHIFFDDQLSHLQSAQVLTPSAQVPSLTERDSLFGDAARVDAKPTALLTMPSRPGDRKARGGGAASRSPKQRAAVSSRGGLEPQASEPPSSPNEQPSAPGTPTEAIVD